MPSVDWEMTRGMAVLVAVAVPVVAGLTVWALLVRVPRWRAHVAAGVARRRECREARRRAVAAAMDRHPASLDPPADTLHRATPGGAEFLADIPTQCDGGER